MDRAEIRKHLAQGAEIEAEVAQRRAALDVNAATIARAKTTLPLLEEKNATARTLFAKQAGARPPVLESEQALIEKRAELAAATADTRRIEAEAAAAQAKMDGLVAGFLADAGDRRTKALQKMAGLDQQIAKARQRERYRRLVSPVAGVVQNVKIHTPGAVVTTADTLMTIVPDGTGLEVEASVANDDIGFVREGQEVAVKIDAFPFTRYGLVKGVVRKLSRDAGRSAAPARTDMGTPAGEGASGSAPQGAGDLAYSAKVTLDPDWLAVEGKRERFQPGMRVAAEIWTGDRRALEFLLSPLRRTSAEAGRER